MGAVYRAHHLAMDRKVAVKLLKPHLTNDGGATERFIREARATMKVDSDHAVKVLDFGITPQRDYYMVLEFLDGRTVQKELDVDGPFAPARVVHIAKQALRALGAAHDSGLVHRDIKPDNILLMRVGDDPDFTKVLDFGVAKLMDGAAKTSRSALAITQAGMVFGTPEYMSPEQACGQSLDGRSDLYSLAATMFAMLTGCGMYNASSAIEWLTNHARTPAPHLSDGEPELARYKELDEVLQRCLAKNRELRPRNAREMIQLLEAVEPTLRGAATSAASSTAKGLAMRAAQSSYIAAVDPNATLVPGAAPPVAPSPPLAASAASPDAPYRKTVLGNLTADEVRASLSQLARAPTTMPGHRATPGHHAAPPTSDTAAVPPKSNRGAWLALGGAAIVAMIVAVAIVASRDKTKPASRDVPPKHIVADNVIADNAVAKSVEARGDAAAMEPVALVDAGIASTEAANAAAPVDAAVTAKPDKPHKPDKPDKRDKPRGNPELAQMIADAEAAQRAGNRLRQMALADSALRIDPRNVKAKLLLADALIATGDRDRGCKYLHDLGRHAAAVARAKQAGCVSN